MTILRLYTGYSKKNASTLNCCNCVNYYLETIKYISKYRKAPQALSTICIQTCFRLPPLDSAVNGNGGSTTKGVLCSAIREVRIGHYSTA
jgi:hypothetical protein